MSYLRLQPEQSRVAVNAIQLFEALEQHRAQARQVEGSMHWKRIKGRDYLYRCYTGGKNHSIGPRSEETERIKQTFDAGKAEFKTRDASLKEQLLLHAAYVRANRLNRFPTPGARVIRALQRHGIPFRIIGTSALYAFEARAGVMIEPQHLATADMDVLMDARQGLRIVTALEGKTLLSIIQASDRSFKPMTPGPFEFRAANAKGYMIDLITQVTSPMAVSEFERHLDAGDLKPVGIDSLKWALASPLFEAVVFDERGMPLRLTTIDPRAFVLHKWHVSQQPDRDALKRHRDEAQARLVATLLHHELKELPTTNAVKRAFPHLLTQQAEEALDDFDV
ncbi:MAG: GSU2403 family nucleotidyltransferase fold protein [Halomonas sp.]|uniref:GSU2403 family nucleotidyltransferase fold protein n=1 Tax=Halomonas sp. TaxID=1486246 RepID=UPI002ACED04F|nr:GSU2403 family nucleotidyltransferase fold protein [Halomonas sp.]MDZ7852033.1 GSU2403 family nucleotidyltransferase fold protein [Halomonas sp.]